MQRYLGKKKIARIYIDNQDKYNGKPLWEELLRKVKECGLAGATVFKGVAGIGAHSEIRSFNIWVMSQELPIIIEIIDEEEKIMNFLNNADEMIEEGLTTLSDIEVIKYKHK